jgi:hypothetical protein
VQINAVHAIVLCPHFYPSSSSELASELSEHSELVNVLSVGPVFCAILYIWAVEAPTFTVFSKRRCLFVKFMPGHHFSVNFSHAGCVGITVVQLLCIMHSVPL